MVIARLLCVVSVCCYMHILLYESPSGNQVDGLPLVLHNTRAVVVDVPHPPAKIDCMLKMLTMKDYFSDCYIRK